MKIDGRCHCGEIA